jgi:hypothetical protein
MNQTEKKSIYKKRAALENEELLFQQCLSSITSRKRYLKLELVELGVSSSALRVGNMMEYYLTNKNLN